MAEFALGLTKTAVEGTVSRVKLAIDEETKRKVKVQNDLMFITGEFQMMQSFLNVANKERAKNEVVRTWVRQIRDLAFDVEDCVELDISLDIKSDWSWIWRVVPSCMVPPRPLDQAVAEIHLLKARVQDVSQRNTRYNLIGSDGVSGVSSDSAALDQQPPASFNILHAVWEAAGEGHFTRDLKHLITSEGTDRQVISVWVSTSIPGGGASAAHPEAEAVYVIKEAYDDPEIRREFKTRAWVKLMHPFDPDEFLESLLTQLYCNSHRPNMGAELGQKLKAAVAMEHDELMQQLRQQSYLVILEDVTSVVEWDAIRMYLPDTNNGSRIVVYTAQHVRLARFCTGEPYRVSELTRISDCQSLCAFSNKLSVRRSDMGELNWQMRRGGVISVLCGDDVEDRRHQLHRICEVYKYIMHKRKEFNGLVEFKEQSWVDVPDPFDMQAFSVRLFLDFQRRDFQTNEIAAVGEGGHQAIVKRCCRYLREDDCLVVINGLQSKKHWDEINKIFLLSGKPITKGTSIIVITKEESVARHCVDHKQDRVFDEKDVDADKALNRLTKDYEGCGIGGKEDSRRAHLLFHDPDDAYCWVNNFELVGRQNEVDALERQIKDPGVISVWGLSGVGKSVIVKTVYYSQMYFTFSLFEEFSFVDVPDGDPFDLTDFSWHLLLDFYSRHPEAKEKVVIALCKGKQDPIQECCRLLQQKKCLVIIDGLRSEDDWDTIRATFLSSDQPTQGCIVVITNDESVARHCVVDDRVLGVERLRVLRHRPLRELGPPVRFLYDREEAHTSWATEYHLVGRKEESSWLRHIFPGVSSLWGVAGVGKSALVRSRYRLDVSGSPGICRSWVDVPNPFHMTEFSRRLLMGFHSNDLQAMEIAAVGIMEGQETVLACCKILRDNTCFLVIDGLRSTHDWDLIRASFLSEHTDQRRCTVVVISNEASVATHCASHDNGGVLNVKCLNAAHSLRLFKEIAWGAGKNQLTTKEREFSEAILAKCGGLPKVIAAIGEYALPIIYSPFTSISTLHHDFIGMLEMGSRFHSLRGLFCWMQSYFDACSDSLKPCIFYLSIFQDIRRGRMLRRWIAEGYSTDTSASGTAEDNGEMLFAQLVESSIIQEQQTPSSSNSSKMVYQVNGFFLEYIKSRPMEDNLVFALEGHCRPNMQRTGQHLAIMSSWDRDKIVFESMDLTRLRSLTVFGDWKSFFISSDTKMRLLRVLDLEDATSGVTDDVLEQILKLLPRLKFLSVRGCQYITRVPDSLVGLRQLQTLDVRHTSIVKLSSAIIKLVKLQYLRAGTTNTSLVEGNSDVPVVADVDGVSTNQAAADRDGASTSQKAAGDGDGASTNQTAAASDGGVARTSQTAAAEGEGRSTRQTTAAEGDGKSTSRTAGATDSDVTSTSQQAAADKDGASTSQIAADKVRKSITVASCCRRAHDLVVSLRKKLRRRPRHDDGSVDVVPAAVEGIGKLTALHTFGVVNVSGGAGAFLLKELERLTQLRKLGVSGINRENWRVLCSTISGHGHLESLSVWFDDEQDLFYFDEKFEPPKTLKSLKLYGGGNGNGNVHVSPVWLKQLGNLKKVHLELTISTQEDIDSLMELPCQDMFRHLRVKPIRDCELHYGRRESSWRGAHFKAAKALKIDCGSYKLKIVFGNWIPEYVEVLVVHCSSATESSLEISGLDRLPRLKEVQLKGSYNEAVNQHLQQIVAEQNNNLS